MTRRNIIAIITASLIATVITNTSLAFMAWFSVRFGTHGDAGDIWFAAIMWTICILGCGTMSVMFWYYTVIGIIKNYEREIRS
jgi:hypothetical protein